MTFRTEHGSPAAKMYRSGRHTIKQIAKFYGVREKTVSQAFREMEVPLHPRVVWDKRKRKFSHEEALADYASGLSMCAVARKHGVTKSRIAHIIDMNGVPRHAIAYRRPTCVYISQVRVLLARGFSRRYISETIGVSKSAVSRAEASLGAPARTSPRFQAWVAKLAREAA